MKAALTVYLVVTTILYIGFMTQVVSAAVHMTDTSVQMMQLVQMVQLMNTTLDRQKCNTVWCLSDLSCEEDFAIALPPTGYYVSEYYQYNGKCFLYKVGDGKTTSMFEEQKRDRVLTESSDGSSVKCTKIRTFIQRRHLLVRIAKSFNTSVSLAAKCLQKSRKSVADRFNSICADQVSAGVVVLSQDLTPVEVSFILLDACTSVAKGGQLKVEEILTCNTYHDYFTNDVVTLLQGFYDITEWIFSFQTGVIILVHIAFFVLTLLLIEMMKREYFQDDFPNDSEMELLFGVAWTLTLS